MQKNWLLCFGAVILAVALIAGGCGDSGPAEEEITVAQYTGADSCQSCHGEIYSDWEKSWHTVKATAGPAQGGGELVYDWVKDQWEELETYMIVDRKDSNTIYVATGKADLDEIDFVIGYTVKQRYAVYYDGGPLEVWEAVTEDGGISWTLDKSETFAFEGNKERAGYNFLFIETRPNGTQNPNNYGEFRSWQERCIACHTTGFDYAAWDQAKEEYLSGEREDLKDLFVADIRISCESCHGPGSIHAATEAADDIFNPVKSDDYEERMNACAQCHTRAEGSKLLASANDLRGYIPGSGQSYMELATFVRPAWETGSRNVSIDGKGRRGHQQDMDMRVTRYLNPNGYHSNQTCFDCHDPHRVGVNPENPRLKAGIAEGCVTCHKDYTIAELLDGARGWEAGKYGNWATESGRGANKQHLFNLNADNLVFGLLPQDYHWALKEGGDSTVKEDWVPIWPWEKAWFEKVGQETFVGPAPWEQ